MVITCATVDVAGLVKAASLAAKASVPIPDVAATVTPVMPLASVPVGKVIVIVAGSIA